MGASWATREGLETVARRWVAAGWQRGDTGAVYALYAPNFVDLGAIEARAASREGNIAGIAQLYAAFPDFFAIVDDLVLDAEAGKVAVRWTATGTHRGEFFGTAPTGKRITFRGIETLRVEDGLITERAGEWDGLAILEQLRAG